MIHENLFFKRQVIRSPLSRRSRETINPHQAFVTKEELANKAETTFYTFECWARGLHSWLELTTESAEVCSFADKICRLKIPFYVYHSYHYFQSLYR
jgi:hypothetical protein